MDSRLGSRVWGNRGQVPLAPVFGDFVVWAAVEPNVKKQPYNHNST